MTTERIDLSSFFDQAELSIETIDRFADAAHATQSARERFEDLTRQYQERVEAGNGDHLRLGLALWILGRYSEAWEHLKSAPDTRERHYYAAQAAAALDRFDAALEEYRQAARLGWDRLDIDMRMAAIQVRKGDLAAAEKLVSEHAQAGPDRAEWYFARGLVAEAGGDRQAALDNFDKCMTLDPDHVEAMFRAARLYDLSGEDEKALELYQRLTLQPRAYVNALMNAAVIYEDIGRYEDAAACLRRVLRAFPNHARARLFYKDVQSSMQMVIEEGVREPVDLRARLLDTPLTDFELSVRARNCLKKMNIRTLGELIRLTEAELLAYKNFGETSLIEIKNLLAKKGLRLGMSPDEIDVEKLEEQAAVPLPPVPAGQEAVLNKPVAELELSVRARRCLQRLNVQTLGDLIKYTEADLLATRNFGVTSLNEVKARLAEHGLQLAPKKTT